MEIFLLYLVVILISPEVYSGEDLEELDRFLREITIDNGPNITKTELPRNNDTAVIEAKSEDPEADKFIEDLKALAGQDSTPINKVRQQPEKIEEKTPNEFDILKKETLENHPELFYIIKLNGSSFRVKLTINRTWTRDMLYPSNLQYAMAESQLAKTFNTAYHEDPEFLNFHMLSFNYRNNVSFYCDFILNFKTRDEHLKPFLKAFLSKNLSGLPILTDDLDVYVIEINPANFESCPPGCDTNCDKVKCPPQCCRETKEKTTTTTTKVAETTTQAPMLHIEYINSSNFEDWGLNNSFLQDEVMRIVHDMATNSSYHEEQQEPSRPNLQEGSNREIERTFSDFAALNQRAYVPYEYYQPGQVNAHYQVPSLPYQPYETLISASKTNQFFRPDKRAEVPSSPRFEQPTQNNFIPNTPRAMSSIRPQSYNYGSNFHVFYPENKPKNSAGVTQERGTARSNVRSNYKIWFPRV